MTLGAVVKPHTGNGDSETAESFQDRTLAGYDDHAAHSAHLAAEAEAEMAAALWRSQQVAKAQADQQAAIATLTAKVATEEQKRAVALQAAAQARALAEQDVAQALWRAKEAAQIERQALNSAQEKERASRDANLAAAASRRNADELHRLYLAAEAAANQEYSFANDKVKLAENERQNVLLASQTKSLTDEAAALAIKKAKSAEVAFWKAKQTGWAWYS